MFGPYLSAMVAGLLGLLAIVGTFELIMAAAERGGDDTTEDTA